MHTYRASMSFSLIAWCFSVLIDMIFLFVYIVVFIFNDWENLSLELNLFDFYKQLHVCDFVSEKILQILNILLVREKPFIQFSIIVKSSENLIECINNWNLYCVKWCEQCHSWERYDANLKLMIFTLLCLRWALSAQ